MADLPQMDEVFSTMVQSVGFKEKTNELFVRWNNGKLGVYKGVPLQVYEELRKAPSIGSMINSDIKRNYGYSPLS